MFTLIRFFIHTEMSEQTQPIEPTNYDQHPFVTSNITLDDYLMRFNLLSDKQQHELCIQACIARRTKGGFIVKNKNLDNGTPIYNTCTVKDLTDRLYQSKTFTHEVRTENSSNGKTTINIKTVSEEFSPMTYIKKKDDSAAPLAIYHDVALMSRTPGVLSLYIPPQHSQASDEFALKFITRMRERFHNPEAFDEMMRAHAYRFRHPDAHIEEVFINFSIEGKTGKTTLMNVIDSLYPNLSMIGIKSKEASSSFDGFMTKYLNLGFEELENEAYRNKFFETFIKQITSKKTSVRMMYSDTTTGEYKCIVSLNTNSEDLYGLIRADDATIQRLVILHFKPAVCDAEANAFAQEFGLDEAADDYQDRKNLLAASLYHYLRYTLKLPTDYRAKRYYGKDKYEIIRQLRENSNRVPMRFIRTLALSPYKHSASTGGQILQQRKCDGVPHVFASLGDLEKAFSAYLSTHATAKERSMYSVTSVVEELTRTLGWTSKRYNHNTLLGYQTPESEFMEWSKSNADAAPDDESDEDELTDTAN